MKKNNKGFTLMEMLIVVAIIAILVAISIPVFTAQLEKARENTDIANMRAAKAEAVAMYLTEDAKISKTAATTLSYDASKGTLETAAPTVKYGKGTATDGGVKYDGYTATQSYDGKYIEVTIALDGGVTMEWK